MNPRHARPDEVLDGLIEDTFRHVLAAPERKPAAHLPKRLNGLFRELAKDEPSNDPDDIEDLIWALWVSHPEPDAASAMMQACEAMAAGALDLARPILDRLVEQHPDWPEAWNKRAVLSFITRQDAHSISDIARTLELEPRHFGAISGFGQICVRHGRLIEARAAFQVALGIDPHLKGLREMVAQISAAGGPAVH